MTHNMVTVFTQPTARYDVGWIKLNNDEYCRLRLGRNVKIKGRFQFFKKRKIMEIEPIFGFDDDGCSYLHGVIVVNKMFLYELPNWRISH